MMQVIVTIDSRGRIYLPKKFRDHLGWKFPCKCVIRDDGDKIIVEPIQK